MQLIIDNLIVISCALGFLTSCWVWIRFIYYRNLVNKIDYSMRVYRDIQAGGNAEYNWSIELLSQIDQILTGNGS